MQKFPISSDEFLTEFSTVAYEEAPEHRPENISVAFEKATREKQNEVIYAAGKPVHLNSKKVYYTGEYQNGLMDGKGSFSGTEGMYIGEFRNGHINGHGTFYFNNGAVYEGDWLNDVRHGFGTMVMPGGKPSYKGQWNDDLPNGKGIMSRSDGAVVEGMFKDGFSGVGEITYEDGNVYRGEFTDGERDGMGVIYTPDGEKFIGQFRGLELWEGILRQADNLEFSITNGREIKELPIGSNLTNGFSLMPLINKHQQVQ